MSINVSYFVISTLRNTSIPEIVRCQVSYIAHAFSNFANFSSAMIFENKQQTCYLSCSAFQDLSDAVRYVEFCVAARKVMEYRLEW